MSSLTYGFAAAPAYRASGGLTSRQRLMAWGGVIGLHLVVLGGLAVARIEPAEAEPEQALMVSFVSQNLAQPQASVPQLQPAQLQPPQPQAQPLPRQPQPPTPAPKLMASTQSTAAVSAAPAEAPLVEARPQPAPSAPAAAPSATAAAEPASAAGPITPPSYNLAYLRNPPPRYPEVSRRKREEGVVRLRVRVNPDGTPAQVTVQRSSGFEALDQAALTVVQSKWKFAPATQGGRPVAGVAIIPIPFSLKTS